MFGWVEFWFFLTAPAVPPMPSTTYHGFSAEKVKCLPCHRIQPRHRLWLFFAGNESAAEILLLFSKTSQNLRNLLCQAFWPPSGPVWGGASECLGMPRNSLGELRRDSSRNSSGEGFSAIWARMVCIPGSGKPNPSVPRGVPRNASGFACCPRPPCCRPRSVCRRNRFF